MNVLPADGVEAFVLRVFILFSEATLSFVTAVEAILVPELTGPPPVPGDEPEEFLLGLGVGSETTVAGGSDVAAVLACTFGVLLAFLLLFVEVVVVVVVVFAPAACLATETAAEEAGVAAADEAVEPGTIWRVGVAWRADGGRVAGVFGVGVCCRPERRPAATSGSTVVAVVFEVTMVLEFTDVAPELGVTMELMTVVAEVAVAVVLAELLTAVELLDLPLVLVLTLEVFKKTYKLKIHSY